MILQFQKFFVKNIFLFSNETLPTSSKGHNNHFFAIVSSKYFTIRKKFFFDNKVDIIKKVSNYFYEYPLKLVERDSVENKKLLS